ncbi:MAG: GspE/PulE family protein [Clostridiales bacterium]
MAKLKNIRIGEVLKEYGYITETQLVEALAVQRGSGSKRLGSIMMEMGYVTEKQMLAALGKRLDIPVVDIDGRSLNIESVRRIPKQLATKYHLIALGEDGGRLTVAINDPMDFYGIEDVRQTTNMPIGLVLAEMEQIHQAIDYYYSEIHAKDSAKSMNESADELAALTAESEENTDDQAPVVQLVSSLLLRGYSTGASDIHIEPFENTTTVRMRIDGMMVNYVELAAAMHPSVIARIKILSDLDIAEKRAPQDGHFRIKLEGNEMNIRVSVIPTVYGEKAVLRFLSGNSAIDCSGQFGIADKDNYDKLTQMMKMPHGIIYLTGPTGSGKTTTLYMVLERLAQQAVNISTIEDPVERNLTKINQMQVNPLAGVTFDSGLHALLRQDPDIIMVGETRDSETANISVRAAITGHLVLSTLHTNDAISSIVRLVDMGIPQFLIANSLVGVVAQRLVRKVCNNCAEEYQGAPEELGVLNVKSATLRRGKGCHYCNNTGYKGRMAVHEIVIIDKNIRQMIIEKRPMDEIVKYATQVQKMKTLKDCVTGLVLSGQTTMEEMLKLTCFTD